MASTLRSLYICYLSLDDPLVETQVVAYLEGLADRGHTIHLLTYEVRPLDRTERREIRERLRRRGIAWHSLRYHKRPSLPATIYDAACGVVLGALIVRRHRLQAVHARSHVPAAAGLFLRGMTGCRLIFDIRGLMAEEYEDAGRWKRGSLPFRITKWIERAAIARSAAVVVLTERVRHYLFGKEPLRFVRVIPCCADVERLQAQHSERDAMRERLGLRDATVLVYVGKFTGWYMEREMVEFFAAAGQVMQRSHFLVLTQSPPDHIVEEFKRLQLAPDRYTVTHCTPEELGAYLSAADCGISFIRPAFSKISTSPTKIGEYLAGGLPVVCGAGVGDVDELLEANRVGVLVTEFSDRGYAEAARALDEFRKEPAAPERCRSVAERHLSLRNVGIPSYDELYRFVAELRSGMPETTG
jgi:glycosyltransferase involved in cell wall biosynthesis